MSSNLSSSTRSGLTRASASKARTTGFPSRDRTAASAHRCAYTMRVVWSRSVSRGWRPMGSTPARNAEIASSSAGASTQRHRFAAAVG